MKRLLILLIIIVALASTVMAIMQLPAFGRLPRGARLARCQQSPNWRDGAFQNQHPVRAIVPSPGQSRLGLLWEMLTTKADSLRPPTPVEAVKTDLKALPPERDYIVWFGHSSYLIQLAGKRYLIDPVFYNAAPVTWLIKPYEGTDIYKPSDMPPIDYIIISHDHYDHLSHRTVVELLPKVGHVVCGLGVGEHFERWGYPPEKIIELDWYDTAQLGVSSRAELDSAILLRGETTAPTKPHAESLQVYTDSITCLPSRHFSGRGLRRNKTLWASYILSAGGKHIFIGGDGGYDDRFARFGELFPTIDLAILENGQYNPHWPDIHTLPHQLLLEVQEMKPRRVMTVHHLKFTLARHPWNEPYRNEQMLRDNGIDLISPKIGEVVDL